MAGIKDRIKIIDRAATELAEMVTEYEELIPDRFKYITDRMAITAAEVKNISETLTQAGVPDEELFTALGVECGDF